MYICICKGVTESQISEAIGRGLCTRKAIAGCLKAGTGCGKCGTEIRELLQRHGAEEQPALTLVVGEGAEHKPAFPRTATAHVNLPSRGRRGGQVIGEAPRQQSVLASA